MTDIEYIKIENFERIAEMALQEVPSGKSKINYVMAYELDFNSNKTSSLTDVHETAKLWRSEERPSQLYFSHGEYRKGGLKHISNELHNKPTSNRALYSLLNQDLISNSGDEPIPSFVLFQCVFDEEDKQTLYCNVYFRALELKEFFRINLEEIRLNLLDIYEQIKFKNLKLLIIATRAYQSAGFLPLGKPEFDTIKAVHLGKIVGDKEFKELSKLLKTKAVIESSPDLTNLVHLKDAFETYKVEQHICKLLKDTLIIYERKIAERAKDSHSLDIRKDDEAIVKKLDEICEELNQLS